MKLIAPSFVENHSKIKENCNLGYLKLPDSLAMMGVTFKEVFNKCLNLSQSIIPIALFRAAQALDNSLPFLYTNPNPNAPILVFLIF